MPASDHRVQYYLGEVRRLTDQYKAGGWGSFQALQELFQFLLGNTVLPASETIRLIKGDRANAMTLGGWRGDHPLGLKDGRFLRFCVALYLDPAAAYRLKVELASYQYQLTRDNGSWVFRYDYLRFPPNREPSAHLQIRGTFRDLCLPGAHAGLEKVRFPTGRVSIEALIRLLVEVFQVPCEGWRDVWRPVLAESERYFLEIAHPPRDDIAARP